MPVVMLMCETLQNPARVPSERTPPKKVDISDTRASGDIRRKAKFQGVVVLLKRPISAVAC